MQEILLAIFEPLKSIHPAIYTIIIAFVPLIELRGSIPVAIAMGQPAWQAFAWSVLGSMIPAFFVIPLFDIVLKWLDEKQIWPWLSNFLNKKFADKAAKVNAQNEAVGESSKKVWHKELLKFWSIVTFVAIPLPGTGVWTGSAIASIIKMPFKKAFLAVLLGDIIAGIIVTLISIGVKTGVGLL